MLVDDAAVFDDEGGDSSQSAAGSSAGLTRSDRSLQTLHDLAQTAPVHVESRDPFALKVRPPGPNWREIYPAMSTGARGDLLRRMDARAPEEVLKRLRQLAREPGVTGVAAWRQLRDRERTVQQSVDAAKIARGPAAGSLASLSCGMNLNRRMSNLATTSRKRVEGNKAGVPKPPPQRDPGVRAAREPAVARLAGL